MIGDWIYDHLGWFVSASIIILGIAFYFSVKHNNEREAKFMQECIDDGKKRYECEAMWRAGEPDYVPVYIPVPTGR